MSILPEAVHRFVRSVFKTARSNPIERKLEPCIEFSTKPNTCSIRTRIFEMILLNILSSALRDLQRVFLRQVKSSAPLFLRLI